VVQKKKSKWDGKSRVSTDLYRKNFEEIFKKGVVNTKTTLWRSKRIITRTR